MGVSCPAFHSMSPHRLLTLCSASLHTATAARLTNVHRFQNLKLMPTLDCWTSIPHISVCLSSTSPPSCNSNHWDKLWSVWTIHSILQNNDKSLEDQRKVISFLMLPDFSNWTAFWKVPRFRRLSWEQQHAHDNVFGALMGWHSLGKTAERGEKNPVPVPLNPTRISNRLDRGQTQVTAINLHNTFEPCYNDIGLCDTPPIPSDILWYQ